MKLTAKDLDLHQIALSGQCFRMDEAADGTFTIIAGRRFLKAVPAACDGTSEDTTYDLSCTQAEFDQYWNSYFDLGYDYSAVKALVPSEDTYLTNAASFGGGIRILRQDLWETIISFMISQQNNIPRIKKCINNICTRYGERITAPCGDIYYSFPSPCALAGATIDELLECNLGYRAKYVQKAARDAVTGRLDLEGIKNADPAAARSALLECYGIGNKVADCVCLFSLHNIDAFPVDTHIKQVLAREYPDGFPFELYTGCAGIIQQYIFYYELYGPRL